MKAINMHNGRARWSDVNHPTFNDESESSAILKVLCAGVCRTDILAAQGHIPVQDGRILGHEFCGEISALNDPKRQYPYLQQGQRVAVNPIIPCGCCAYCRQGDSYLCGDTGLFGLDCDGAFAEYIHVPLSACYPVNPSLSDALVAYAEPVAAMLSVAHCGLRAEQRIGLVGDDRITALCRFILNVHGIDTHRIDDISECDALVVTKPEAHLPLEKVVTGGTVILKTRVPNDLTLNYAAMVYRRLTLIGVNYAPFQDALNFIERHQAALTQFLGETYPFSQFHTAFAANNAKKVFLCAD